MANRQAQSRPAYAGSTLALDAPELVRYRGTWSVAPAYALGDWVIHAGLLYRLTKVAGLVGGANPATNTTDWSALTAAATAGTSGPDAITLMGGY